MIKVSLDDLPTRGKTNQVNWKKCIELRCKIPFVYKDLEGVVTIVGYDYPNLEVKYNDNICKITISTFRSGAIGRLLGERTSEFKVEIGQVFKDNKRDLVIVDREIRDRENNEGNNKWYKYKCNKCGYNEGWIVEHSLLTQKNGCSCCAGRPVLGINTIWDTDRWMCDLGVFEEDAKKYTRGNSSQKVKVKCPDCGYEKEMIIRNIHRRKSIGCSACSDGFSQGHKYIHSLLTQLNLEFKDNYSFDWCKFYNHYRDKNTEGEYDFVIEDMKLIIEVDGSFHRNDNEMSGQKKEESKYLDDIKDKLASEHGYKVIRVIYDDCDINIKDDILCSELTCIFDLSDINWLKCEEFTLNNICKSVCELKRNNPEMTTTEISEIMKLGKTTVRRYLNKGTKLGWCNYDGKKESIRSSKMGGKQVEIFKDGKSLGVFESCIEVEKQSERLFEIKLNNSSISLASRGLIKSYKGFTFQYVEKLNNNQLA